MKALLIFFLKLTYVPLFVFAVGRCSAHHFLLSCVELFWKRSGTVHMPNVDGAKNHPTILSRVVMLGHRFFAK